MGAAGHACRRRAPWIAAGVALVALSGCSGDTPTVAPAPTVAPGQPGPLEEMLGLATSTDSAQDLVADASWRETLTAQCMAELGFTYLPVVPDAGSVVFSDAPTFGTREYVEAHGYGVWNPPRDEGGSVGYTSTDPNWQRVEAMSEAERAAYDVALRGEMHPSEDDSVTSYAGGGCSDASTMPVDDDTRYLLSIREEAVQFLENLLGDPAFSRVNAAWAACMEGAGFREESPIAAQYRVMDEYTAETDGGQHTTDTTAPGEEEVRLATADLDCREETGWQAEHTAIQHRLQQGYVDDHQAELDELVAVVGTGERPD